MINIDRIRASNYLLIKELNWNVSKHPLWVVRGQNHDAESYTGHSGNGIGKSLIFNGLATLWLAQPPFSKKKNSVKDLLTEKAEFSIEGEANKPFLIRQYVEKGVGYEIQEGKKDLKVYRIADARKKIQEILPIHAEHFYSQVYINSFRPSVLQYGTPSQRYDFMEDIFNLSIYDRINKILLKMAADTKYKKQNLVELQEESKDLVVKNVGKLNKRLKVLQKKLEKYLESMQKGQERLDKLNSIVPLFSKLETGYSESKLEKLLTKYKKLVKECDAAITAYYENMAAIKKYEESITEKNKNIERKNTLKKKMLLIYREDEWGNAEKEYSKVQDSIKEIDEFLKLREENLPVLQKYWTTWFEPYEEIVSAFDTSSGYKKSLEGLEKDKASTEQIIHKLSNLAKKKECPTCYRELSKGDLEILLKDAKSKLISLDDKIVALKALIWRDEIKTTFSKRLLESFSIANGLEEKERLIGLLSLHFDFINMYEQYKSIKIPTLKKPKYIKVDIDTLKRNLKIYNDKVSRYKTELEVVQIIGKNFSSEQKEKLEQERKNLQHSTKKLYELLTPLQNKVQNLVSIVTKAKIDKAQKVKLEEQIRELEKDTEDHDVIQILLEIYSPKGVRIEHIRALLDNYIALLNQYSSSIFSEKIKFSSVVKGSQFSILSTRGKRTSDVNSLSGAESRQFLALSALVLRMLMPESQRCNLMILDEIEAGLSETNRTLFCQNFIPLLLDHVPNVIVVTPYNQGVLPLPKAKELYLVRKNNVTTAEIKNA